MKPLVFWCRWNEATLRLHGRDEGAVWGELAFADRTERFHFELEGWVLSIGEGEGRRVLQLDEMGIEAEGGTRRADGG